jgi:calcineurin-like phosphoesterase family protein
MAILFTADTHFGHGGALGLYRRPFASVAEMDEGLIARWNLAVAADDEVYHLGDFAVRQNRARVEALLAGLAGRKHLVTGNNDGEATTRAAGWISVAPYLELRLEGVLLVLCHYPFRTWRDMTKGALNLHGHSHGRLKPLARQIDVGVDVYEFRPVTLQTLLDRRRPGPRPPKPGRNDRDG